MKWFCRCAMIGVSLFTAAAAGELEKVHNVYFLQMSHGLDQYLANQITGRDLFNVVTDPHKAEAVFTDRLGPGFEARLDELLRPKDAPKKKDDEQAVRVNTMSRGQGTVFLVDAKTRTVLWSTYQKPRAAGSREVNRSAEEIAAKLEKALRGK